MSIYKGIFWYVPGEHRLIAVKVACDERGNSLENANYSSKSGENFNHKIEWSKLHKDITQKNPYNYYPRGRVEIKNVKATIFFNPVLNRFDIHDLIMKEFGLIGTRIIVKEVADGSKHYEYLIDFEPTKCTMCSNVFDNWDYQENFCLDYHIGYGSKYDCNRLKLNLCIDCFDKVLDFILPKCKTNPLSELHIVGEVPYEQE